MDVLPLNSGEFFGGSALSVGRLGIPGSDGATPYRREFRRGEIMSRFAEDCPSPTREAGERHRREDTGEGR
jgi:hypothetical protein